jgi:hypothetical protein
MMRFVRPWYGDISSVITRRKIANIKNNKLRSEKIKGGICVAYTLRF